MEKIVFVKNYSNKKKGHKMQVDRPFANKLIALKVAKFDKGDEPKTKKAE